MNDTQITVQGFVGGVVSLRQAGETEVATFRLGCTPRHFNRRTGEWADAPTQWYSVNAWRGLARNVAGSLVKGDAVTVVGRLNVSTWAPQDGGERTTLEIEATSVGHDLRHGTARLARNERVPREEGAPASVRSGPDGPAEPVSDELAPDELAPDELAPGEPLGHADEPQPDPVGDWRDPGSSAA